MNYSLNQTLALLVFASLPFILASCENVIDFDLDPRNVLSIDEAIIVFDRADSAMVFSGLISRQEGARFIQHGHCWATHENPVLEDNRDTLGPLDQVQDFSSVIRGLTPGSRYFVRAYVQLPNNLPVYSPSVVFEVPVIGFLSIPKTISVDNISTNTARAVGEVNRTAGNFPISTYGHCWGDQPEVTIESALDTTALADTGDAFTSNLSDLAPDRVYYVRSYTLSANPNLPEDATLHVRYGNVVRFRTISE